MFAYIKNECLRQIKSKRYIVSLLLMSLSILILFQLFFTMSKTEGFNEEESYLTNNDMALVEAELYNLKMFKELDENSDQGGVITYSNTNNYFSNTALQNMSVTLDETEKEIRKFESVVNEEAYAFKSGDMNTYMKKAIHNAYYLLLSNEELFRMIPPPLNYSEDDYYKHVQNVAEKYHPPKVDFQYFRAGNNAYGSLYASVFRQMQPDIGFFKTAYDRILYYDALLESNHTPINMYQVDSVAIAYQTFRIIYPIAIPLLVIFLFFDQYDNDHRQGSIKTITTLPRGRQTYLFGNIISNMIVCLSVLLIPLILFMLILGIKDGFHLWNYPMLADGQPFSTNIYPSNIGAMSEVYKTNTNGLFPYTHFGLSQVSNYNINEIPPGDGAPTYWGQMRGVNPNRLYISDRLAWTNLGTILIRSLPLIITFTLSIVTLILLLNITLEKKMTVLISSISILLLLQALSPYSSTHSFAWINPLQFRNAVYSVIGFTSYSLTLGLISTLLSSSLVIISSYIYLLKKNIT